MPTYSYQCKRCEHTQDVFHSMSATPRMKCEACGGPCVRLLGTGAGIIFKGSGFYETDYKNKGRKPASESASHKEKSDAKPAEKSGDSASKSSGDSKPAAKAKAS